MNSKPTFGPVFTQISSVLPTSGRLHRDWIHPHPSISCQGASSKVEPSVASIVNSQSISSHLEVATVRDVFFSEPLARVGDPIQSREHPTTQTCTDICKKGGSLAITCC